MIIYTNKTQQMKIITNSFIYFSKKTLFNLILFWKFKILKAAEVAVADLFLVLLVFVLVLFSPFIEPVYEAFP